MEIKTLKEIPIKKHFQIKKLIKKADTLGLNNVEGNSIIKTCAIIEDLLRSKDSSKVNKNVTTIHCEFDYFKEFDKFNKTGTISFNEPEIAFCSSYNYKDGLLIDEHTLIYTISQELQKNRIVFLFMDLLNYITCNGETNTYSNHSVCSVFIPKKSNNYDFLYFNSHGNSVLEHTHYERILSRRRTKNIKLPIPMDYYFNQTLIQYLNQYMKTNYYDVHVNYKPSSKFNYQHFNLQCGDNYGICFVFPYIIWHSIIYNYSESETVNTGEYSSIFTKQLKIPSVRYLLTHHKLFRFMEKILLHYDKEFKHLILKNWFESKSKTTKLLEDFIEKKQTVFVKNIVYFMVSFIGQKKIKDKILE